MLTESFTVDDIPSCYVARRSHGARGSIESKEVVLLEEEVESDTTEEVSIEVKEDW